MTKLFYVYQLRAENEHYPFYIGKGTGRRIKEHGVESKMHTNTLKNNKIKNLISKGIKFISEKLYESYNEQSCFEMEIFLIKSYGRKDIGTGILCNHTNGGEGVSVISKELSKRKSDYIKEIIEKVNHNLIITKKYTDEEANSYINQYEESKLSITDYCQKVKINIGTFRKWLKKHNRFKKHKSRLTIEEKINHLKRQKESKTSINDYCVNNNIARCMFFKWKKLYRFI